LQCSAIFEAPDSSCFGLAPNAAQHWDVGDFHGFASFHQPGQLVGLRPPIAERAVERRHNQMAELERQDMRQLAAADALRSLSGQLRRDLAAA